MSSLEGVVAKHQTAREGRWKDREGHGREGAGEASGFLGPSPALSWTLGDLEQDTSLPGRCVLVFTRRGVLVMV